MVIKREELLSGWGRTAPSSATVAELAPGESPAALLAEAGSRGVVARGLGRAYGDAAQNGGGLVVEVSGATMSLDPATGILIADAGTSLDDIMRRFVPHGWFVPVTPGTRYVTIGGAIAADIHGKNHHRVGTFGAHVTSLDLLVADGSIRTVAPDSEVTEDRELFRATVGGMGLTGIILSAAIQMNPIQSSLISVDTRRCANLDDLMAEMVSADEKYTYSVAWIDSVAKGPRFGRGVLTSGEHASLDQLPKAKADDPLAYDPSMLATAPPFVPGGLLNKMSMAAFNELWYRKAPKQRDDEIQSIAEFFHPLDGVSEWNRIYGPEGFLQYQFAVSDEQSWLVGHALEELQRIGASSFLSVLKRFGPENGCYLSFPTKGWTLALDIPAGIPGLGATLDELDRDLIGAGGRLYLAKDSRGSVETNEAGYPMLADFRRVKAAVDPNHLFSSDLSRRLDL